MTTRTTTAEERQEIAKTILAQLGGNHFRVMTGADLDQPEEIYIEAVPNSKVFFEYGDRILSVRGDGFVKITKDDRK